MKILISGYGKMGRLIESRALEAGWQAAAVIDPLFGAHGVSGERGASGGQGAATAAGTPVYTKLGDVPAGTLDNAIAVDFTHPSCVCKNITSFAEQHIPVVVGTTGWYDRLHEMSAVIMRNNSSMLWAGNFSLGVNLMYKIAEYAAALICRYAEYDVSGYEFHHNKKADSPSGTAKTLAQKTMAASLGRKTAAVYDKLDRPPEPHELHFASLRSGSIPGLHAIVFDSPADTIEITHNARSRDGLVSGALAAAHWLAKQTTAGASGVWTFDDVLNNS
ncbi:MAG: 4-hydroxy-tetrahydrodipicolinate reductase [Spirochaetaceae bacterium]|jgi:4-hydroxy-tetrahydrodipicolinate reductase|nr:4-hydroxy-tetrahydrodipicolinate reductase [Spirochaetaceae bacterium]